ncbi:MAG: hypothetical protein KDA22_06895 [Phycisphaerales bacterium]|nr:hypothetical protein [Phycisphaerales bacterium]
MHNEALGAIFDGVIVLFGATLGTLLGYLLPDRPVQGADNELWRRRFRLILRIGGPVLIAVGLLQITGGIVRWNRQHATAAATAGDHAPIGPSRGEQHDAARVDPAPSRP